MGAVYEEFERELAVWRTKYVRQPRRELIRLFLLALEREEIVSVAYREDLMLARLQAMPLPPNVRELIHHALLWAWKDEEMHAIYIRGAILRLGSRWLCARAFASQVAGGLGGWAGSIRQHVRWRQAPVSRLLATGLTWAGKLSGQVPQDVAEYLRYRPFRDFCLFNVDAEKTAWLCWNRITELSNTQPDLPPHLKADFARVQGDEERHGQIFAILAAALDEHDRLTPGYTAESLAAQIGTVGECFLPRRMRAVAAARNPLGSGGQVWVREDKDSKDKATFFSTLLSECGLKHQLEERARTAGKKLSDVRVAIKPTFMLGYHRKDPSTLTDPLLLDVLARYLIELGCADVAVVEGRNIYDKFFQNRSVQAVADYFQLSSENYRIVDCSEEQVPHSYFRGMGQYTVARTWKDADFRITFGKMRSHPVELALNAVGNLEWIGARCDEFLFVERQAHRETAVMMLIDEFPPHFALLDAYDNVPDGLLGVMGCPRPKAVRRLYAGADALAVDCVACRHMGMKSPRDSTLLRAACHWFGAADARIEVIGCDELISGWRGPYHNELSALLSFLAFPVYVHGSGRGSLFVPEMDEQAFPPLVPEGRMLRATRGIVRALVGLRHPR